MFDEYLQEIDGVLREKVAELPALQHDFEIFPLSDRLELVVSHLLPRLHTQKRHEKRGAE